MSSTQTTTPRAMPAPVESVPLGDEVVLAGCGEIGSFMIDKGMVRCMRDGKSILRLFVTMAFSDNMAMVVILVSDIDMSRRRLS